MAADNVTRLELAIDTSVALLHSAWIPRHIEMKHIPAMSLQVETFSGGVSGDQNANRVLLWRSVECTLDLFSAFWWRRAVKDFDANTGLVGFRNGRRQLLNQVPLGVFVLGED